MKTSDFFFDLPDERIAYYPPPRRGDSRLMLLDRQTGSRRHCVVSDLPELLAGPEFRGRVSPGSAGSGENAAALDTAKSKAPLLVFNNSRVRKARVRAKLVLNAADAPRDSTETEFLLLKRIDTHTWQTMVNRAKRRRSGQRYCFEGGVEGEIVMPPDARPAGAAVSDGGFRYIRFDSPIDDDWLDTHGHIPLPPYIKRDDEGSDSERYQTVYSSRTAGFGLGPGASSAAPTAGLHFTDELFAGFAEAGIESVFVTLHVGLGTFLPVRTEKIEDHVMHEEVYSISEAAAEKINAAKAEGRKIIAVGTTAVRTLESAWDGREVRSGEAATSIFIYPGYRFKVVDALFTNFHTPGSTLLMLVSAFAGQDCGGQALADTRNSADGGDVSTGWTCAAADSVGAGDRGRRLIMESYAEAVRKQYRFFSYGDAMLIY